jgi:hypothetical protein
MTKTFSPIQKMAAVFGIALAACGVPLGVITIKLRDESGLARMEWEAGRRSLESKDRCAQAALDGVREARRKATYPAHITKAQAAKIEGRVEEACRPESSSHVGTMGPDMAGHPVGLQDAGQDAARGG